MWRLLWTSHGNKVPLWDKRDFLETPRSVLATIIIPIFLKLDVQPVI